MSIERLETWLDENGVYINKDAIEIAYMYRNESGSTDRGCLCIRAKRSLDVDEVVSRIPRASCLSLETSEIGSMLIDNDIHGALALTVCVMFEWHLGDKSKWFDYLATIPKREDLPITWFLPETTSLKRKRRSKNEATDMYPKKYLDAEKELLMTTDASHVLDDLEHLKVDFEMVQNEIFSADKKRFSSKSSFSFDRFVSASTVVASRCFRIDDDVGEALIPLADIFNHEVQEHVHLEYDPSNNSHDDNNDQIDMRIIRNVGKGEEVMNTYGDHHSNAYFLGKYGFVTKQFNPNDMVSFEVKQILDAVGPSCNERLEFWLTHVRNNETGKSNESDVEEEDLEEQGVVIETDNDQPEEENEEESELDLSDEEGEGHFEDLDSFQIQGEGKPEEALVMFLNLMTLSEPDYDLVAHGNKTLHTELSDAAKPVLHNIVQNRFNQYQSSLEQELEKMAFYEEKLQSSYKGNFSRVHSRRMLNIHALRRCEMKVLLDCDKLLKV